MSFAIVTDTSANLPTPLTQQWGVTVVPFCYYIDGAEHACTDTEAFDGEGYYNGMRRGVKVTTSQVSPGRYMDYMRPLLEAGQDVLYIGMSSGISGSFASAGIAAEGLREEFPERQIRLVDTYGASLGEGLMVRRAVLCRDEGQNIEETEAALLALRPRMYQVFTVDDLMHLRRSGRLSNLSAVVGTVLHIKPLLKGNERGQIISFEKIRGRRQAIEALAAKYDTLAQNPGEQVVGIAHAGCEAEAHYLEELLRKNRPPREILTVCYEPVTGSHVGPGTLALFFEGDADVRLK